jgi:hypothetical protein
MQKVRNAAKHGGPVAAKRLLFVRAFRLETCKHAARFFVCYHCCSAYLSAVSEAVSLCAALLCWRSSGNTPSLLWAMLFGSEALRRGSRVCHSVTFRAVLRI